MSEKQAADNDSTSALFLGEPLTWRSLLGIALIVGGTLAIVL
ncbi:hypothetical protein [Pseudanabaena sp. PCC 6802]|nr:hypothetical protein [Pseudanabaena sp. PCC 6802]